MIEGEVLIKSIREEWIKLAITQLNQLETWKLIYH